jgi:hypothetical protein
LCAGQEGRKRDRAREREQRKEVEGAGWNEVMVRGGSGGRGEEVNARKRGEVDARRECMVSCIAFDYLG